MKLKEMIPKDLLKSLFPRFMTRRSPFSTAFHVNQRKKRRGELLPTRWMSGHWLRTSVASYVHSVDKPLIRDGGGLTLVGLFLRNYGNVSN